MSLRQQISQQVTQRLERMRNPQPMLVTREPFDVTKIAITEFPALLISFIDEERETITMGLPGLGRRAGTIRLEVRGFVRGTDLDDQRTALITAIETVLEQDRYLGLRSQGVTNSQVTLIEVIPRIPPLAEFRVEFRVNYNYERGTP